MKESKSRIVWVDCAKAIGMFFIVLGHTFPTRLNPFIYSFSVPLFFYISGYLCPIERIGISCAWKKIWYSLIIPLALLFFVNNLIGSYHSSKILFDLGYYFDALCGKHSAIGTLWFVYDLIIVKFIFLISNKFIRSLLFCISLVVTFALDHYDMHAANPLITIWGGYVFLWIGSLFKANQHNLPHLSTHNRFLLAIILTIIVFVSAKNPLYMFIGEFNHCVFLSILLALLGISAISLWGSLFHQTPYELYVISIGSIVVMAEHAWLLNIFNPNTYFSKILCSICIMLFFVGIIPFLTRYCPLLFGVKHSFSTYYQNPKK